MSHLTKFGLIGAAVAVFLVLFTLFETATNIGPEEIVSIQAPVSGKISWNTTPGWACRCFGTVTRYTKRFEYKFPREGLDHEGQPLGGLKVRFADGGHATMFGSVQFTLPTDTPHLDKILSLYPSQQALVDLAATVTSKSTYLTGTLMTSRESYAEKRNDLVHYVTDQINHSTYRTGEVEQDIKDDVTGAIKRTKLAQILVDDKGQPLRQETSILDDLGITGFNFSAPDMPYDRAIEDQIRNQQQLTMAVQTKIAEAKQAEQRALTAEADGRADATQAKWKQETIKAQAVTQAEQEKQVAETNAAREFNVAQTNAKQRLTVADLDQQAAEKKKQENILLGQGESERRKLVMAADGALQPKLDAYVKVQQAYAEAFKNARLVPSIVMGQQPGANSNPAVDLVQLMNLKTLKEMELKLDMPNGQVK